MSSGPGKVYSNVPRRTAFPSTLSLFNFFPELSPVGVRPWPPRGGESRPHCL